MEVTKHNFHEVLTELEEVLSKATFVSIDGEFTGLNSGDETTPWDTPAEYYRKIRTGAMDFLFVQFGLAVFHLDEKTKQYTHRCYNFYIYPRPSFPGSPDTMFLSQASSLDFLIKNNFNFNKLFLEGIPYLNRLDEHKARTKLEEERKERRESLSRLEEMSIPIPEELSSIVTNALEQITEFLHNKSLNEIAIKDCNRFVRKLIYQEAWKKFSRNDLSLETNSFNIIAKRMTAAERIEEDKKKLEMETKELDEAVGFTKLIQLLSRADKLIVGHNMCLDLCHILHRFCMPLPDSYEDFKEMLHCLFPKIMDTKQLCCHPDVKDRLTSSVLNQLIDIVQKPPFYLPGVEPELPDYGYRINDYKEHEAGYDAYITGLVYIALTDCICRVNWPRPKSEVLKQSFNKLFIMKVRDTHINLEGPDPEVSREHVFHIMYPRNWTYRDINQIFSPYGMIFISRLNDTTALVSLKNKQNCLQVEHDLVRSKMNTPSGVKIIPYDTYVSLQEGSKTKDILSQSPSLEVAYVSVQERNNTNNMISTQSPSLQVTKKRSFGEDIGHSVKRRRTDDDGVAVLLTMVNKKYLFNKRLLDSDWFK